jgi:putative ABC transport system permease protein
MTGTLGDLRFALRALWRHRAFTVAVVLTLAVGFGATTAVFSVYHAALLRPLDVPDPDRLVFLHRYETSRGYYSSSSYPAFTDYRERVAADVVVLAAYASGSATLEHRGRRRVAAAMASDGYFDVAGVSPLRGRVLTEADGVHAALIGERLWAEAFDRDEGVVGRGVAVGDTLVTIVGILPASFGGFERDRRAEIWLPLEAADGFVESAGQRGRDWLEVAGRLGAGVDRRQAEQALRAAGASLAAEHPETEANWTLALTAGAQGNIYPHVRERMANLLSTMGAAALLLLLVTCGTAANLTIARMQGRDRELRVRLAIGAGRRHLLRLLVVEHALVAAAAGAGGALLASWIPALFAAHTLPGGVRLADLPVAFDLTHAAFAGLLLLLLIVALTALSTPVWWRRRGADPPETATERLLVRRALVGAQVGLSVALLFGGGLLVKALAGQIDLDAGFRAQRMLMATIDLPAARHWTPEAGARSPAPALDGEVFRTIRSRLASTPGVVSASWSFIVPYGARRMQTSLMPEGASAGDVPAGFVANVVDVGYFETVGVPILHGRAFTEADRRGAERVIVVTESLAARYWPGREPLGRWMAGRTVDGAVSWTVIGVVPDGLPYDIRTLRGGQREHVFFPLAQMYEDGMTQFAHSMTLLAATDGRPLALAERVRTVIGEEAHVEPALTTAGRHVDAALSQEWLAATTGSSIAALALALAAIGLYGIVRYTVTRRTREIGIRIALGATPRAIVKLALGDAAWTLVPGALAGLAVLWPVARMLQPLLHDVRPFDPGVLAASLALSAAATLIAVWLPARVAAHLEPAVALRAE